MRGERKLKAEIEVLRQEVERSKADLASLQMKSEESEMKEKERDRLVDSTLEYWKAQYDFQKHLMTVGVAAAGVFIALLGGFFGGPKPWSICIVFDALGNPSPWVIGNRVASVAIVCIFAGFLVSVISAPLAAHFAKSMIEHVPRIREDNKNIAPSTATKFEWWSAVSARALSIALERVMNLGKNRIEMWIPRSAWFVRDLRFPHS